MKERLEDEPVAFVDGMIMSVDEMTADDIDRAVIQGASMVIVISRHVRWFNEVAKALRAHGARTIVGLPDDVRMGLEISRPFEPGDFEETLRSEPEEE